MKQPQQTYCTPETRRSFDDEFKRQAIALMETGRPVRHLARELEVTASMLYAWKRNFGSSVSSSTPPASDLGSLQEENRSLKAEVAHLRQREEILKNARHPLRTKRERFQRIEAMKAHYPIAQLCMALGVSRSGFYAWSNHSPSRRVQENQRLTEQILTVHTSSRHTYGSPRIRIKLQASGMEIGRRRIARIMRQQRIVGRCRKRRSPRTTHSDHDHPIAPNLLQDRGPA